MAAKRHRDKRLRTHTPRRMARNSSEIVDGQASLFDADHKHCVATLAVLQRWHRNETACDILP